MNKRVIITINHCDSKMIKKKKWVREDQVKDLICNFFRKNEGVYVIDKEDLLKLFGISK